MKNKHFGLFLITKIIVLIKFKHSSFTGFHLDCENYCIVVYLNGNILKLKT